MLGLKGTYADLRNDAVLNDAFAFEPIHFADQTLKGELLGADNYKNQNTLPPKTALG